MLSQIAAGFRLQQGHQVTDLDKELIFGPFLGRKRAGVALDSELLDAAARHFVALQGHDLLCGSRRQVSAQGRNNPTQQLRGSAFRSHSDTTSHPETLANPFLGAAKALNRPISGSERLDLDVAEGDRVVVPGETERALRAVLAGMRAAPHEVLNGG